MPRTRKSNNNINTQKTTEVVEVVLEQDTQQPSESTAEVVEPTVEAEIEAPIIEASVETPTVEKTAVEATVPEISQQESIELPTVATESTIPTASTAVTPPSEVPIDVPPVETISVADACAQLSMPEQMFRLALQQSHSSDFDTLKELPLEEFKVIAETLQHRILGGSQTTQQPPQPPQEQQQQQPPQQSTTSNLAPTESSLPTDQRQKLEAGTNNALALFAGEYVITLDKITSALAYTSSKASLNNFVTIHSNVFRDGLENYLEEFAEEMTTAAHSIAQVRPTDFLHNHGVVPKERRAIRAIAQGAAPEVIAEIMNLAPQV